MADNPANTIATKYRVDIGNVVLLTDDYGYRKGCFSFYCLQQYVESSIMRYESQNDIYKIDVDLKIILKR